MEYKCEYCGYEGSEHGVQPRMNFEGNKRVEDIEIKCCPWCSEHKMFYEVTK